MQQQSSVNEEGAMDLSKLNSASTNTGSSNHSNGTLSAKSPLHRHPPPPNQPSVICATNQSNDTKNNVCESSVSPAGIDLSVSASRRNTCESPLTSSCSLVTPVQHPPTPSSTATTASSSPHQSRIEKVLQRYQATAIMTLNGPDCLAYNRSLYPTPPNTQHDAIELTKTGTSQEERTLDLRVSSINAVTRAIVSSNSHTTTSVATNSTSSSSLTSLKDYDPLLVPPPFPIQQPPLLTPPDQSPCERSETLLEGELIACFTVSGEKRLCFPQILNIVLRDFTLNQINAVVKELQIYCSTCTTEQMEVLKRAGDIPNTAPSCGLITKTDAHRLCSTLLAFNPPQRDFSNVPGVMQIYHECFGSCVGRYAPSLYNKPDSLCIQCEECMGVFSPPDFVSHSHRSRENRTVHWGFDPRNWRSYVLPIEDCSYETSISSITVSGADCRTQCSVPLCCGGRKAFKSASSRRLVSADTQSAMFYSKPLVRVKAVMKEMKSRFLSPTNSTTTSNLVTCLPSSSSISSSASSLSSSSTASSSTPPLPPSANSSIIIATSSSSPSIVSNKRKNIDNYPLSKDVHRSPLSNVPLVPSTIVPANTGSSLSASDSLCSLSKRIKTEQTDKSISGIGLVSNPLDTGSTNTCTTQPSPPSALASALAALNAYPFLQSYLTTTTPSGNMAQTGTPATSAVANLLSSNQILANWLTNVNTVQTQTSSSAAAAVAAATAFLKSSSPLLASMSAADLAKLKEFSASPTNGGVVPVIAPTPTALYPQIFFAATNNNSTGSNDLNGPSHHQLLVDSLMEQQQQSHNNKLSSLKSDFPMTYENLTKALLSGSEKLKKECPKSMDIGVTSLLHQFGDKSTAAAKISTASSLAPSPVSTSYSKLTSSLASNDSSISGNILRINTSSPKVPLSSSLGHPKYESDSGARFETESKVDDVCGYAKSNTAPLGHINLVNSSLDLRLHTLKHCLTDTKYEALKQILANIESLVDGSFPNSGSEDNSFKTRLFSSIVQLMDVVIPTTTQTKLVPNNSDELFKLLVHKSEPANESWQKSSKHRNSSDDSRMEEEIDVMNTSATSDEVRTVTGSDRFDRLNGLADQSHLSKCSSPESASKSVSGQCFQPIEFPSKSSSPTLVIKANPKASKHTSSVCSSPVQSASPPVSPPHSCSGVATVLTSSSSSSSSSRSSSSCASPTPNTDTNKNAARDGFGMNFDNLNTLQTAISSIKANSCLRVNHPIIAGSRVDAGSNQSPMLVTTGSPN